MKLGFLLAWILVGLSTTVVAQGPPATRASLLQWDEVGDTVAEAQAMTYKLYVDALPAVTLTNITCTSAAGVTTATCSVAWPAMTPGGPHTIAVSAVLGADESPKSDPITVTLTVVVKPTNLRKG